MVKFITTVTALAALLSPASAVIFGGSFTNSFDNIRVGQLVKLTWKLDDPSEPIGRVTLLHQYEAGGLNVAQIETVAQWTTSASAGITELDWVPNVAGPLFQFMMDDNGVKSPEFQILAADGSVVATADTNIPHFSNIMPQIQTTLWYPNNPDQVAAATPAPAPSSTSAAKAATTPSPPVLLSSISVVSAPTFTATPIAIVASSTSWPSVATLQTSTSVTSATSTSTSTSVASATSTSVASATSTPTSTSVTFATSTVTYCSKCAATTSTFSSVPLVTGPSVSAVQNSTIAAPTQKPTQNPTQPASNSAVTLKGGLGAVVMGIGFLAWVGVYW